MSDTQNIIARQDWRAAFLEMHPGFFEKPAISALPPDRRYDEMALALDGFSADALQIPVPAGVRFGFYEGDLEAFRRLVARVDDGWPGLYTERDRVYCGFDGDSVASFCMIEDMGVHAGLRFGGPGCVGTLPEYRRRGIGLRMVQNATEILRREGYDISYIHYTGVAGWYARLGYRTVLRWNGRGFLDADT